MIFFSRSNEECAKRCSGLKIVLMSILVMSDVIDVEVAVVVTVVDVVIAVELSVVKVLVSVVVLAVFSLSVILLDGVRDL